MSWGGELFIQPRHEIAILMFVPHAGKHEGNKHQKHSTEHSSQQYIYYFISYTMYEHINDDENTIWILWLSVSLALFTFCWLTPPLITQSVTTLTVAVKWACEKWYLTRSTSKFIAVLFRHDDVIKWEHFPCHWPFVRGIHRSPANSPHKGQWREALMFSLISINVWVNNREAGDWRRHHAHYNVTVMKIAISTSANKGQLIT